MILLIKLPALNAITCIVYMKWQEVILKGSQVSYHATQSTCMVRHKRATLVANFGRHATWYWRLQFSFLQVSFFIKTWLPTKRNSKPCIMVTLQVVCIFFFSYPDNVSSYCIYVVLSCVSRSLLIVWLRHCALWSVMGPFRPVTAKRAYFLIYSCTCRNNA